MKTPTGLYKIYYTWKTRCTITYAIINLTIATYSISEVFMKIYEYKNSRTQVVYYAIKCFTMNMYIFLSAITTFKSPAIHYLIFRCMGICNLQQGVL